MDNDLMTAPTENLMAAAGVYLVSPCCRRTVVPGAHGIACGVCSRWWPWVTPGFLDLSEDDRYWGELPRERMARLLERGRIVGLPVAWKEAASDLQDPNLPRYALSPLRGAFLPHVLPRRRGAALDLGAGFGAVSRELTRYFDVAIAMEPVRERVEHIALARAPGPGRLVPVRATWEELPFARGSFDLVLAVGVLEWVGFSPGQDRPELSPREMQLDFLRRARELLRPGGRLAVGIENRYGFDLLRGAPDHLGLAYTSLLPRRVADHLVRLRKTSARTLFHGDAFASPRYRAWTYEASGYERLFKKAGFERTETLCVWGSYVFPKLLGPARALARILAERPRLRSSAMRRMVWRKLGPAAVRAVSPSFFVVGHLADSEDPQSPRSRTELVLLENHLEGGNYSWALLEDGAPIALIQRPVEPERTSLAFERGLERVRALASRGDTREALSPLLPEPFQLPQNVVPSVAGPVRAWRWFEGRSAIPTTSKELDRLLTAASRALDGLDRAAAALGTRSLTEDEAWTRAIVAAAGRLNEPDLMSLGNAVPSTARTKLARGPWGLVHGDFWWGNLLLDADGRPLLLDWEECEEEGWRPFDPLLFSLTLLLDLYPGDPFAGPWSSRILEWTAEHLGWAREELPAGLELAGLIKAWRERSRYGDRKTPVQRWLLGRPGHHHSL